MLEGKITLFEIALPKFETNNIINAQIISGCNAYIGQYISEDYSVHSELEEESYAYLNSNYRGKALVIDLCLSANKDNIYKDFYVRCVSVRSDNGFLIKIDGPKNEKYNSRINMQGDSVIGIGLFLNDEQYESLSEANRIGIEGAFALGKKTNVYGFNINVSRTEEGYDLQTANTYKLKGRNINHLAH